MKNINLFEENIEFSPEEVHSCWEIKIDKEEVFFIADAFKFSYPRAKIKKELTKDYVIYLLSFLKNKDIEGLKKELKKKD